MEFIPFENVAKIELVYSWNSQVCENVLHYKSPSSITAGDLEDAADAAANNWKTNIGPTLTNALTLVKVKATDLTSQDAPAIEWPVDPPAAGGSAAGSVPNNVTAVIKFTTALRGRSYRGRFYVAGLNTNNIVNSTLNAGSITALTSIGESLMELTVNAETWPLVIASRFHNKVQRTTGHAEPVLGAFVESTVDSQRRRLPGRGR